MSLQQQLEQYIKAPDVPENSFAIGYEYELIGQTASAMGYYLKCAELTDNKMLAYECLLRKACCFRTQGDREAHVKNSCHLAIALLPKRPEAYHLLSISHELCGQWHESYAWAMAGEPHKEMAAPPMKTDCGYHGNFVIPFQQAVALWHIGRFDDCRDKFHEVQDGFELTHGYDGHVQWNIDNLEGRDADALSRGIKSALTNKEEIIKKLKEKKSK